MSKKILGLDLGSNSVGWALLEQNDGEITGVIDLGSRIFTKAVEEKVPTPKNVKRRDMRLGRRVLQRRSKRKQRMLNYLVSLNLLPRELQNHKQPEILLNAIGDPYGLRAKALDIELKPYEFGRILLHFVARRGFLSSKKQVAGDLIDDPDTIAYLSDLDSDASTDKEETAFKADIALVRDEITASNSRTLGEYLNQLERGECKRNRNHAGRHLRTDRQMYSDEIELIWLKQKEYFGHLPQDFMQDKLGIKQIIFYQRPLKLKKDRVGKCSLETKNYRAPMARLAVQRFRYLQDINNLQYFERETEQWVSITKEDKNQLKTIFEVSEKVTITKIKKELGLGRQHKLNLESKVIKGNITAYEIRNVIEELWDNYKNETQEALVEDLLSIKLKSALKRRLTGHWGFDADIAIQLSLLEFEPSHSSHSLKAINKLLPLLEQGFIYSDARQKAGYDYEVKEITATEKLGAPPETSNPIVNRGLYELKRVINAIIKHYGKPDAIRVEMARDLEMNTKRYKDNEARQKKNQNANQKAVDEYQKLGLGKYPNYDDKLKYRLWEEQDKRCAYSNKSISLNDVFTAQVEIDHILPYKKSLDDSYMNKVVCYTAENRFKGDRTPRDAWNGSQEKWLQITQAISHWKGLDSKVKRFYQTENDLKKRDFISTQLNDTRYISKLAIEYVKQLGCDVTTSKGMTTAWLRHQWGLNSLIGETNKKERTDHRHHAIDAAVVACVDRSLYKRILHWTQTNEQKIKVQPPKPDFRDELSEHLKHVVVSHAPQRKLSGSLHEETGAGYIEKHGGLVYRKNLDPSFTLKNANSIVDEAVKLMVIKHLSLHGNEPKIAFSDGNVLLHKDGKTPIKRVRVLQSKTTEKKLAINKFGVKDKAGKVFKYMSYGNMHHVEIIKNIETGKYKGVFVNMMQASHRAKGIQSVRNPKGSKSPIIQTKYDDFEFIMALHINDLIGIKEPITGEQQFYRIQKLDSGSKRFVLRRNTASTLSNKYEELYVSINREAFERLNLTVYKMNAIGIFQDDQKNS